MKLYTDGLTLVYHEARHVRFLIRDRYLDPAGWDSFVSFLARGRVEAWKQIQPFREASYRKLTVVDATLVFSQRFGRDLPDLLALYGNPGWKHSSAYGGNAWRDVTQLVIDLEKALGDSSEAEIKQAGGRLIKGRHNNGQLRDKIADLDNSVGVARPNWWFNSDA